MAPPSERYVRESARLALTGVLFALISSCGESGYDVGVGGPSESAAGKPAQAGGRSMAGVATADIGGRGGATNNQAAGRSGLLLGGSAGTSVSSSAGRGGSYGGAGSTAGNFGIAGDRPGSGGIDTTAAGGAMETTGGNTSTASGGSGGTPSTGGADSGAGTASTSGGTSNTNGGTSNSSAGTTPTVGGAAAGNSGVAGRTSTAGSGPCGLLPNPTGDRSKRRMLLRDEGVAKLALVDVGTPANGWVVPLVQEQTSTIQGRDMQLVGNCRVMIGTDVGYEEYDLSTGQRLSGVTTFPGIFSAHRLRNNNTVLVGVGTAAAPFQGSVGIVLVEVNAVAAVVNKYVYPGTYARLVRQTSTGTFLVANNTKVFEGDTSNAVSGTSFDASRIPNCTSGYHFWKALRIPTAVAGVSETAVATGYCASLAFFNANGSYRARITGGTLSAPIPGGATAVNPYFFSDFQLLSNGNYLVANWAGHGAGNFTKGIPILEYTPSGALAWYWGDPAYKDTLSGIQGVILLDGLDPTKLHVEDTNGQQVPVN